MPERKKGVVPRLRFPEFRDAGPWEVLQIGSFLTESRIEGTSGDTAKKLTVKLWGEGVVPKNEYLPGSPNTKYYRRRAGQFIYSKLDFLNGAFGLIPEELDGYESTVDLPSFDIGKGLVPRYFLEYVKRPQFYKRYGEQADGSRKAKRVQVGYFLSLPLPVPSPAEQQKIADCLSSLDELITLQAQKLDALKAHKKGLMQQLFPREGETTPRLRFPEFRNAGPWELRALAKVLEEHGEKSNGTEEVYSVSVHKGLVNQIEHLGRSYAAKNTDHYNRVLPGDIVYTKSPTGDFPYGIVKQNKNQKAVIVSPLYGVFRPENYAIGVLIDAFFESPCRAKTFLEPLVQKGAKNTINISNARFLSGKLPLPQNPTEQQKIADCLSSLDDLIQREAQKLEALKAHKKGLMQQLFPQEVE
ncbi:restriction endonuclease subunit S [Candidatus Parcubacteria bacterium]|nr:MAG: restriction endonuclease subunit S [Candidatus Parcubacteria bacterium]